MKWFSYLLCFLVLILTVTFFSAGNPKMIVEDLLSTADVQVGGNRPWDITVHNDDFYQRVLKDGSLGLGESYMDGWWDCPSLDQFFFQVTRTNLSGKAKPTWSSAFAVLKAKLFNMESRVRSRKVVEEHYQLGNDLYIRMLDPTMAYTCGYWKNVNNLESAQNAKFDLVCRKLGLKPGMKLLDIGCGWGGFAYYAAKNYGVEVTAVNLSEVQCDYAKEMCVGLPVTIKNQDYRDTYGSFDRVASIGMTEHVGSKNYRELMQVIDRCLKEDGLALVHTIGGNISTVAVEPFIGKYIFQTGHLPSIAQLGKSFEKLFVMEDWHNFSAYYDKTLMAWYSNFDAHWDEIKDKYGDRFYRMWKYYLLACAGAFRARDLQLWQIVLSKGGVIDGYQTVR